MIAVKKQQNLDLSVTIYQIRFQPDQTKNEITHFSDKKYFTSDIFVW